MSSGLVGDSFTLVCALVLAAEMHGKRVVIHFSKYHGNSSFTLQLPPSKPPPVICSEQSGNGRLGGGGRGVASVGITSCGWYAQLHFASNNLCLCDAASAHRCKLCMDLLSCSSESSDVAYNKCILPDLPCVAHPLIESHCQHTMA